MFDRNSRRLLSAIAAMAFAFEINTSNIAGADPGSRERSFVRALELFESAKSADDYRESARVLETIVADGVQSGAVYYNLGNAYYRAGEFGRAILNYRKAKPYRPRDPYLTANLEQALAAAPGRLTEPARPWWIHVLFWTDWLSFPQKIQAAFSLMILSAVIATLSVVLRKRRLRWFALSSLLISIVLGTDAGLSYVDTMNPNRAVITGETIARKGTDNSYEPAFDQPLKDGAEFTILTQTPDWTFGHFESIGDGWVRNEFVAR